MGGEAGGGIVVVVVEGKLLAVRVEDRQARINRRTEAPGEDLEDHGFVARALQPEKILVARRVNASVDDPGRGDLIGTAKTVVRLPFRNLGNGVNVKRDQVGAQRAAGGVQ